MRRQRERAEVSRAIRVARPLLDRGVLAGQQSGAGLRYLNSDELQKQVDSVKLG